MPEMYGGSIQSESAHNAIRQGLHIFPCAPGEKLPTWAQLSEKHRIKWYEYASNDPLLIGQWWAFNPEFNIGVSCKKSGLLVVDCDTPKGELTYGDHVAGIEKFYDLCMSVGADWKTTVDTYQVVTPSGGRHFYYHWPQDVIASQRSLDHLLDVRTNGGEKGGYVVGAGSRTPQGSYTVGKGQDIRRCPQWLIERVQQEPRDAYTKAYTDNFVRPFSPNFAGLHRELKGAREGNRNNMLNWVAYKAFTGNPDMSTDDVEREFYDDAVSIGLSDSEIRATIRSAYRRGKQ